MRKFTISLFDSECRVSTKADVSRHLLTSVLSDRLQAPLTTVTITSTQVKGMELREPAESGLVNSPFSELLGSVLYYQRQVNREEGLGQAQSMCVI